MTAVKRSVTDGLRLKGFVERFGPLRVIAWTGGSTPPPGWPAVGLNGSGVEWCRLERAVFEALLAENVAEWRAFWEQDDIPAEQMEIFENTARLDAWAMSREGFPRIDTPPLRTCTGGEEHF